MKKVFVFAAITLIGLLLGCVPSTALHELPQEYNTIVYIANLEKSFYVAKYDITNGVITIDDYYQTYYSVNPKDDYFIHYTEKIQTSMFTIRPYIRKSK